MAVRPIDFVKLSPAQNMTVLVRSEHPVEGYPKIASAMMSAGHVHAEQVGFVRQPVAPGVDARLHMAADEFCGNACMALAALIISERGLSHESRTDIVLEASGAPEPVRCQVERQSPGYYCRLTMPLPLRVESYPIAGQDPDRSALVVYEGSVHLVVETEQIDEESRDWAEDLVKQLERAYNLPLVGVMLYSANRQQLAPLISLPALGSMTWETSCGSGTASLGAYLATKMKQPVAADVIQPGGTMHVEAHYGHGTVTALDVAVTVRIVAEGRAYVYE